MYDLLVMAKRKKCNQDAAESSSSSFETSSFQTNLELDNRALRVKNGKLVQAVAKLQQEKAQQQLQITQLQEDYFKLNSTFINLKSILTTIDGATRAWLPKFVELSEMFTKIMQLCSVGKAVSLDKDPRTQAVQPHIVNGHILQHPTISLSRMNDIMETPSPRKKSNRSLSRKEESEETAENAIRPSTANQNGPSEETTENLVENGSAETNENDMIIERINNRRRRRNIPVEPSNVEEMQDQEDEESYENGDLNNDEEYRLCTIREEDENNRSSPRSTVVSREMTDNISAIHVPSCSISHIEDDSQSCLTCSHINCQKKHLLNNLGLEPLDPKMTTSTPMLSTSKTKSRTLTDSDSILDPSTPTNNDSRPLARVNKKRGGRTDTNKIAQVILERISLAQRLSGSPLKKNSKILKVPVVVNKMKKKKTTITSSNGYVGNIEGKEKENSDSSEDTSNDSDVIEIKTKRITKLRSLMFPSSSSSSNDDNDAKENIDTSNENSQVRILKIETDRMHLKSATSGSTKKANLKIISKGTKRFGTAPSPKKFKLSPRPKRAARPTTLKEPTLNKKMRRSK